MQFVISHPKKKKCRSSCKYPSSDSSSDNESSSSSGCRSRKSKRGKRGCKGPWLVHGERLNIEVEPSRSQYQLTGIGPYTYLTSR